MVSPRETVVTASTRRAAPRSMNPKLIALSTLLSMSLLAWKA